MSKDLKIIWVSAMFNKILFQQCFLLLPNCDRFQWYFFANSILYILISFSLTIAWLLTITSSHFSTMHPNIKNILGFSHASTGISLGCWRREKFFLILGRSWDDQLGFWHSGKNFSLGWSGKNFSLGWSREILLLWLIREIFLPWLIREKLLPWLSRGSNSGHFLGDYFSQVTL